MITFTTEVLVKTRGRLWRPVIEAVGGEIEPPAAYTRIVQSILILAIEYGFRTSLAYLPQTEQAKPLSYRQVIKEV